MSSLTEAPQQSRKMHADQKLYVPRPRRRANLSGKALKADIKHEVTSQDNLTTQAHNLEPKGGGSRLSAPPVSDTRQPRLR